MPTRTRRTRDSRLKELKQRAKRGDRGAAWVLREHYGIKWVHGDPKRPGQPSERFVRNIRRFTRRKALLEAARAGEKKAQALCLKLYRLKVTTYFGEQTG